MKTECGVIGLFSLNKGNLIEEIVDGLTQIQHRGQDSSGISYTYNDIIMNYKRNGLINEVFKGESYDYVKDNHKDINSIIGHVRYTTSGSKKKNIEYAQPMHYSKKQSFSISFNGNLPDIKKIYPDIEVDTFGIIKYLSQNKNNMVNNLIEFQNNIPGVYCLIVLYNNEIYVTRDRYGIRPLSIGEDIINNKYCISSETVVMDYLKYDFIRDIFPGEILKIGFDGITNIYQNTNVGETRCLFEYIYFLRPTSIFGNINATEFREKCGRQLALYDTEFIDKYKNDITVVGCPNSGICSGVEYANTFNLTYKQVIKRNPNSKRTFILASNEERIRALKLKYNLDDENIRDKIIILVDDSVVRGNTLNILLDQINNCKPKQLHVRIAAPPVISQCYFGIDIPTKEELVYNTHNNEEKLIKHFNVNSFKYLDLEYISSIFNSKLCNSCFTGKYNNKLLDW